jgi:disulfide bond formation protein DsbB
MKKYLVLFEERNLNLAAIFVLCFSMGLGFFVEFVEGQVPCILCFLQRIIIMGIAVSLYFNLLIGVSSRFYGFALIWSLAGLACSLRHMAINICKEVPFGAYLLGSYRLYTWSFLLFFTSIFAMALLLCIDKKRVTLLKNLRKDAVIWTASSLILLMLGIGFFSAINRCGLSF